MTSKKDVLTKLQITEKELDDLEYDYMKIHKENIEAILSMKDKYAEWYVSALVEWKTKRKQ